MKSKFDCTNCFVEKNIVKSFTITVCSDDNHEVFVDSKLIARGSLNTPNIVSFKRSAKVIAIAVSNVRDNAGFIVTLLDGSIVTDGSWKCSSIEVADWMNVDFDDSLWTSAATTGGRSYCSLGLSLSPAKWMWHDKYY